MLKILAGRKQLVKLLQSTKKFLIRSENVQIILLVFVWRIWLCVFALIGIAFVPRYSPHFFGGGSENYNSNPLFWGWANFDGEHYLSIAQSGYKSLEYSFFPVYPLLLHYLALPFGLSLANIVLVGLLLSNILFFGVCLIFWYLVRLDYSKEIAWYALLTLLLFPTSFYFVSLYTESLYLFLTLGTFYFVRKGHWFQAGLLGSISSATRIVGITLLPALFLEILTAWKKHSKISFLALFLIPVGLIAYMSYVYLNFGSPIDFYRLQTLSGEQRQESLVLLPQVFWRYIKILATTRFDPIYITVVAELLVGILTPLVIIWGLLKKMRLSYLVFAFLGYILPTFTGSFSSLPRYILVLFPLFILLGIFLFSKGKLFKIVFFTTSVILLAIEVMLFIRGYWVA